MPIVFVHGVGVRNRDDWPALESRLREDIAPVISTDPAGVLILDAAWGEVAAKFRFDRASVPAAPGSEVEGERLRRAAGGPLLAAGPEAGGEMVRLSELSDDELADFALFCLERTPGADPDVARVAVIQVGHDPAIRELLARTPAASDQAEVFAERLSDAYIERAGARTRLLAQGGDGVRERIGEAVTRAVELPLFLVSRVAAEFAWPMKRLLSDFFGDVFVYLKNRTAENGAPGPIPTKVLEKLVEADRSKRARGDEPLVVVTHSMGGQIVYDCITHFMPRHCELKRTVVDYWVATASQVGLFEELGLLIEQHPDTGTGKGRVPFPSPHRLRHWWNVWDHVDPLSFTADPVFKGVKDEPYSSGGIFLAAHGNYLSRGSFFRKFRENLAAALAPEDEKGT